MGLVALFLPVRGRMQKLFFRNSVRRLQLKQKLNRRHHFSNKHLLMLAKIIVFMMVFSGTAFKAVSQRITLQRTNVPLQTVFADIEKQQTQYRFFYNESLLEKTRNVTIDLKNVPLEDALKDCFRNQPVTYALVDNTIIVRKREESNNNQQSISDRRDKITISGKVVNSKGEPIEGATVSVKGTDMAIATDANGVFTLADIDEDATLVISSVAHFEQEVKLNRRNSLTISLREKVGDLDEAVVVAYNTTTKRSNVGAITVVKGEQIQTLPNRSVDKSLQGLVTGLQITQGTGMPGGGVASFVLRGIATGGSTNLGETSRNPLIVVDGIPVFQDPVQIRNASITYNNPMAQLNPSDIATITVLKDAAAIALYGSKASNGVILITTKKGKIGKTVFSFRHQADIAKRLDGNAEMLSQQEYLELVYETFKNTNPGFYTDSRIDSILKKNFPTRPDGSFYPPSDWLNELYNPHATTLTNELSVSGGNEKQNFYINLEWTKQNGVEKSSEYDRKSIRFNYENRPASWLKLGINTALSYNVQNYGGYSTEGDAAMMSPLNPIWDENGDYIYHYNWGALRNTSLSPTTAYYPNPVVRQLLNINRNVSYRGLSKLYAECKFFKYFTFTPLVGIDFMLTEAKEKIHPKLSIEDGNPPGVGQIQERDIRNANLITTNILRYDRVFKKDHSVNILAGHEAQILTTKFLALVKQNLGSNPVTDQLNVGTLILGSGLSSKQTLLSYFGQANYGFRSKYFLSGSIRTDGSSLFGDNKRFGTHWSTGVGWLVSSESFMKGTAGWLDYLKIRGSFGSAGNSAAILNTIRYDPLVLVAFLNGVAVYPSTTDVGNPGIQWEKTFSWDAGLDIKLLKERIALTADIYTRKTSKLIGTRPIAYATGYRNLLDNIGDLTNRGVELSISADIFRIHHFRWNINANWSTNANRLTRASAKFMAISGQVLANEEGRNYQSFYLAQWAGVDPATGKPLWIDSAGKPNSSFAAAKPEFVGKPQPDGFGGITNTFFYKGFEFSATFYYQYGSEIYHSPSTMPFLLNDGVNPFLNQTKASLNRWQKPGDIVANPRRILFGKDINNVSDGSTNPSTRYLFDGDFVRLSNLMLAYIFPKSILDRIHLQGIKVYLQGYNLALWTKYSGRQDPENVSALGSAANIYPLQRSYTMGINVNF